jgi:hypothetical protein
MSDGRHWQQQQRQPVYGGTPVSQTQSQWPAGPHVPAPGGHGWMPVPQPVPSTWMLTVAKWVTVGIVGLLIPLIILWIMHGYKNLEGLRRLSARVAGVNSGDGKGLKGGAEAIAWWEFLIVLEWATLAAVVLIGIFAFLAGVGQSWARIVCTVLMVFPVAVIIFGVIDSGPDGLWGLIFLVPFIALVVLWWLPGTSRGLKAKAGVSAPQPVFTPQQQWH